MKKYDFPVVIVSTKALQSQGQLSNSFSGTLNALGIVMCIPTEADAAVSVYDMPVGVSVIIFGPVW